MAFIDYLFESWNNEIGNINSTNDILTWINHLNKATYVNINECSINDGDFWFYDDYNGEILNRKRSFFSIRGMRLFIDNQFIKEQPVIIQPEIGYLGIICKVIDGVLNFLMQAKIEPGNINCVQLSPTIQATKSNFTRVHGGNLPAYFEYFENSRNYTVIYDQIQSEQAARFLKKRNRNMIMLIDEDIEVLPNFKWMTLGQIKKLMEIDNLVNMDTRTVLSGIPITACDLAKVKKDSIRQLFSDNALYNSMFNGRPDIILPQIYQKINNYKMFKDSKTVPVPLNQLVDWEIRPTGITCKKAANYSVRYYNIEISGREVQHWVQPLFKAIGIATFGMITTVNQGRRMFLVKICPEIGSFDKVELGPSIQWEPIHTKDQDTVIDRVFRCLLENDHPKDIDVLLSEEGGRFYHEQNRNIIMSVDANILSEIPEDYLWVDYATLNYLVQVNNCLNIQLRNLLSLLKL